MSIDVIKQHIKNGEFAKLYLFYGDEKYIINYYSNKIAEKAISDSFRDFNFHEFDRQNFDIPRLISAVNNVPMMSEYKCIKLRDIDIDDMKAADWKETEAILKDIPVGCIVIILFDAIKPDKNSANFKSLQRITKKNGVEIEAKRLLKPELCDFAARIIKKRGCRISKETLNYLIDTCGNDMYQLSNEIEKIAAFAGEVEILKNHIDEVAVKPLQQTIYSLASAIISGRTQAGLNALDELFYKKEPPVVILSALSGAFCDLYRAKVALESGFGLSELKSDFNYGRWEFRITNALRDCRKTSREFLSIGIKLILEADMNIKSSRTDERLILEKLITEIALANKGAAF